MNFHQRKRLAHEERRKAKRTRKVNAIFKHCYGAVVRSLASGPSIPRYRMIEDGDYRPEEPGEVTFSLKWCWKPETPQLPRSSS